MRDCEPTCEPKSTGRNVGKKGRSRPWSSRHNRTPSRSGWYPGHLQDRFERRAVVDGPRRTRLSVEGRVRHPRPAVRQCRVQHPAPLESITEAIYDEMFNLNAKGPLFAVQKFAPLINRGGSVVLTTSIANLKGMAGNATYGAAKAALRSFARTLAAELVPSEIRVNAVTPGPLTRRSSAKRFPLTQPLRLGKR